MYVCRYVTLSPMRKVVHPDRLVETLISDCHQSNIKCLLAECAWTTQHGLPEFNVKNIWNLRQYSYYYVPTTRTVKFQRWTEQSRESYQHSYYTWTCSMSPTAIKPPISNWWINVYLSEQRNYSSIWWTCPFLKYRSCFHFVVPRFLLSISESIC